MNKPTSASAPPPFRKAIRLDPDKIQRVTYSVPLSDIPCYAEFHIKDTDDAATYFMVKQIRRIRSGGNGPPIPYFAATHKAVPQFEPRNIDLKVRTSSVEECHPITAVEFALDNGQAEIQSLSSAFQQAMSSFQIAYEQKQLPPSSTAATADQDRWSTFSVPGPDVPVASSASAASSASIVVPATAAASAGSSLTLPSTMLPPTHESSRPFSFPSALVPSRLDIL
jgi:hypothetical protein